MKFIANILTDKSFKDSYLYNVVSKKEDLIENIPTLVIGWEYTKNMYPNANILNWEIEKNIYWTYGNREKRNKYEENLEKFKILSIKHFVKSIQYTYCNILTSSQEDKMHVLDLIENIGSNIYIVNDMIYIMDNVGPKVIGISLRDVDYMGKDRKKIFTKIYQNPNNNVISVTENNLTWDIRNALKNHNYIIPYLFG